MDGGDAEERHEHERAPNAQRGLPAHALTPFSAPSIERTPSSHLCTRSARVRMKRCRAHDATGEKLPWQEVANPKTRGNLANSGFRCVDRALQF
jgi:hypothetical protein